MMPYEDIPQEALDAAALLFANRFGVSKEDVVVEIDRIDEDSDTVHLTIRVAVPDYDKLSFSDIVKGLATALRGTFQDNHVKYFPSYTPIIKEMSHVCA